MATTPLNSPLHHQERVKTFNKRFPLSATLKIEPAALPDKGALGGLWPGYDAEDVQAALGPTRFAVFQSLVKRVFSCGHRKWASTHADPTKANAEVHCYFAEDVEAFIAGGH